MTIYPSKADTGIIFRRMDVPAEVAVVPARFDLVSETRLGTTIRNQHGITVATIEHLMAAIWGVGIDNAVIELDGPEVPIMDGSSEPFVFLLECAGLTTLAANRKVLRVLKTIEVRDGSAGNESVARIQPNVEGDEGCILGIEIQFNHAVVGSQSSRYDFRDVTFKQSLSRARTFGFEHEVTAMRDMGLALGGSLDNAIVVGKDAILNPDGLRYSDEFVRHKALDCLGDLYLAGCRIDARLDFLRPGHAINNKLLRALFADESAYVMADAGAIDASIPVVAATLPAYA
jgi:UDP-3-O-[3-hydroxymyristoyl] N-acetylglucosamine deacetylase